MNPFEILSVDPSCDDTVIRNKYLDLVRKYSPEQYPEQFAKINHAYEMLKDHERRLQYAFFPPNSEERSPIEVLIDHYRHKKDRTPLAEDKLKTFLQQCIIDD
jgi:curved DNA-binding protein CbpA